ncbi:MAG: YncE family protein [Deltaproteobacteria bacterium]|nr:YncE family protein [Deltaproteobacteria bacterium]
MRWAAATLLLAACSSPEDRPVEWSLDESDFWPSLGTYPGVGEGRIVIPNGLDDTVSVLDLAAVGSDDLAVIARVPVGLVPVEREGPHHVATALDGEHYYVGISNFVPGAGSGPHGVHGGGTASGHILKLRTSDNIEVASVRVDRSPGDVRLTPDGTKLLVSHFDLLRITEVLQAGGDEAEMVSKLAIIDPVTMTRETLIDLCPAAHGIVISPDGARAFVSCLDDGLAIVDVASEAHEVTRVTVVPQPGSVSAPACYPYALTRSPSGDSVWVSCYSSGQVLRYDVEAGAMDESLDIRLPGPAAFGTFAADGTLIVPYQMVNGLAFIDPATGDLDTLDLPADLCVAPHMARFTDDDERLLVVCEGDHASPGNLLVMDPETREVERSVELGIFPDDIGILRSGG